jgi:hypothetical protein
MEDDFADMFMRGISELNSSDFRGLISDLAFAKFGSLLRLLALFELYDSLIHDAGRKFDHDEQPERVKPLDAQPRCGIVLSHFLRRGGESMAFRSAVFYRFQLFSSRRAVLGMKKILNSGYQVENLSKALLFGRREA